MKFESLSQLRHLHRVDQNVLRDAEGGSAWAAIKSDMQLISEEELKHFIQKRHFFLKQTPEDDNFDARLWWLSEELHRDLGRERLAALRDNANLKILNPDSEGLVPLSTFSSKPKGFFSTYALPTDGFAYRVHPVTPSDHSSYWLTHKLHELCKQGHEPRVRIDPFAKEPSEDFKGIEMLSHYYGKPLDWNRLFALPDIDFGELWPDSGLTYKHHKTDYMWSRRGNELHFVMEELPSTEDIDRAGSRYFHAILDIESRMVKHVDGAWRIYSPEQFERRIGLALQSRDTGKEGIRRKLFRIDGQLTTQDLVELATTFFYWNLDVTAYFGDERARRILAPDD